MAAEMANGSGVDQRLPGNLSVLSPASRSTRILKGNARTKEETVALETCRVLYARKDGTPGKHAVPRSGCYLLRDQTRRGSTRVRAT